MAENNVLEHPVETYQTTSGIKIFAIPMQLFPILRGFAYLVIDDEMQRAILVDSGSGMPEANAQLEAGIRQVGEKLGRELNINSLDLILITHGHIDHFGGCSFLRSQTKAPIFIHELDIRNLSNYEERIAVVSRRLENFLIEAGVGENQRAHYLELYRITKSLGKSVSEIYTLERLELRDERYQILHVPGHCAGHVVIRIENILLSGDMVLDHISPHQSPERLTLYTGLGHYLESLDTLEKWAVGVELTLCGHGKPIRDLGQRIAGIRSIHEERLSRVLDILKKPQTTFDVAQQLFGEVQGYNILLAIEEAGAHVEFLYSRGLLGIENLQDLENHHAVPILYRRI